MSACLNHLLAGGGGDGLYRRALSDRGRRG